MAEYQIGDNLYADASGRYYSMNNGAKSYVSSPYEEMQQKLNSTYDQQKNQQLAQLRQQRDKAVSGFNQQKQDLAPQYQNQRNQADVVHHQNVAKLRELMAANGINASGENLTTQASLSSSRQGALGDITNNEQLAYREIDKQIADWNDPSREQSIVDSIETERSRSLTDMQRQIQQEIYAKYVDWRNYQMQQQQAEFERRMAEEQLALQKAQAAASRARSSGSRSSGGSSASSSTSANPSLSDLYAQYQQEGGANSVPTLLQLNRSIPARESTKSIAELLAENKKNKASTPYTGRTHGIISPY